MDNSFDKFIDIERDTKILDYTFNSENFLMWPVVRYMVFSKATGQYDSNVSRLRILKRDLLRYFILNSVKYPHFITNKDIVSFGATLDNIMTDGKYFNRVHDYYNFLFPNNTIFFELPDNFTYRRPRAFGNTYYHDYIRFMPLLRSKLVRDIDEKSKNAINEFIKYLKENFPVELDSDFYELIRMQLTKEDKRLKYRKKYFIKLIDKIKPKVLFLNCAYYGGESYIIKWAKERGIVTAEFQHGTVSKSHPAYNYGEGVRNSEEYKKYVPDYFLTYGEYWNNQVRIPGKAYVVGNPHFYESIRKYKDIEEQKNTILIVSQWTMTEEFVKIAEYLAKMFKNMRIIFKMHPGEINNFDIIKPLESFSNVEIRKDGDIYELIARCENIVACYSTVVFEVLAFDKKLYILDNDLSRENIPPEIGVWFDNAEKLAFFIKDNVKSNHYHNADYYFDSNWKENYIKFIREEVELNI